MTEREQIEEFMLTTFKENGFEDTTENRLAFLEGLNEAWLEIEEELTVEERFRKTFYRLALIGMIAVQRMKLNFASW